MQRIIFPNATYYYGSPCEECSRKFGKPYIAQPANKTPTSLICKLNLGNCDNDIDGWAWQNNVKIIKEPYPPEK